MVFWNSVKFFTCLIGSIAGAAISAAGIGILNYSGFIKILQALLISPFIALFVGFLMMSLFKVLLKNRNLFKANKRIRYFQIGTAPSIIHAWNE